VSVRVVLPTHLRSLAQVDSEVELEVNGPVTRAEGTAVAGATPGAATGAGGARRVFRRAVFGAKLDASEAPLTRGDAMDRRIRLTLAALLFPAALLVQAGVAAGQDADTSVDASADAHRTLPPAADQAPEVGAGVSLLAYQSVFAVGAGPAFQVTLRGAAGGSFDWLVGARFGSGPALPEVFGRLVTVKGEGAWRPGVGVELGVTSVVGFEPGAELLREARGATTRGISRVYVAGYAAPLDFRRGRWRVGVAELLVGTHVGHTGRTLRVQVGLFTVSRSL